MTLLIDGLSWVLLSLGGLFVLIGGIGAVRMPDLYSRIHASSVTESLGAILVLIGLMLQSGLTLFTVKLIAILLFLLVTGPTSTNALASAALMAGADPMMDEDNDLDDDEDETLLEENS